MTPPELHADDLLDREARGSLTSEERTHLEEHLAVCSVCRFERAVRADFRAEFEALGPHRQLESSPVLRGGTSRPSRPAVGRSRVRLLSMVAVLLLLAGVAAAELSHGQLLGFVPWLSKTKPTSAPPGSARQLTPKWAQPAGSAPPAESARAGDDLREPVPETSGPKLEASGPGNGTARAPLASPAVVSAPSASTLFDEARMARERGDYEVAVERYQRLLTLFPGSPQALTTHAVLGRLLVDRGRPEVGLKHFDAYLSSGATTLGEEVMLGRALAFGKLGQSVQEAEAWQALLRAFPNSLHAVRARERLGVLPEQ